MSDGPIGADPIGGDPADPPDPPSPPSPITYPPSIITGATLPDGAMGAEYSQPISVENGTTPYVFAVIAGGLPAGIALDPESGLLSGRPTANGSFTFIITVTDADSLTASAAFELAVPSTPTIANSSLQYGSVGVPYNASLTGQGGALPYGFQVISGNLPPGLALATTGGITGLPTTAGSFTFTVQIYDSNKPQGIGSSIFTIVVSQASLTDTVTTMDEIVLIAKEDGGIYAIIPGQRFDTDYAGNQVGFLQKWQGVPASSAKLAQMQLGGASVSAKGSGALNVTAIDDDGNIVSLSTERRPMILDQVEVKRDFMAKGVGKSERFGIGFDNGGVAGSWFELHTAILWVRQFFTGRKG